MLVCYVQDRPKWDRKAFVHTLRSDEVEPWHYVSLVSSTSVWMVPGTVDPTQP